MSPEPSTLYLVSSAKIGQEPQARAVCTEPRAGCGRDIPHVATLELYNTLSGKIETLAPVGAPALRMYCCGPTVYDYGHIGNFRTFLHVDVLRHGHQVPRPLLRPPRWRRRPHVPPPRE